MLGDSEGGHGPVLPSSLFLLLLSSEGAVSKADHWDVIQRKVVGCRSGGRVLEQQQHVGKVAGLPGMALGPIECL